MRAKSMQRGKKTRWSVVSAALLVLDYATLSDLAQDLAIKFYIFFLKHL
jgi:hypothetical protein